MHVKGHQDCYQEPLDIYAQLNVEGKYINESTFQQNYKVKNGP
jgi:hypothetical protein